MYPTAGMDIFGEDTKQQMLLEQFSQIIQYKPTKFTFSKVIF